MRPTRGIFRVCAAVAAHPTMLRRASLMLPWKQQSFTFPENSRSGATPLDYYTAFGLFGCSDSPTPKAADPTELSHTASILKDTFFFLFLRTLFSLGSGGPVSRAYGVSWSIIPSKGLGYKRRGSFLLSPHLDLSGDCELVGCSWRGGGRGCLVTPSWVSWGSEVCVWINGRRRVSKESPT